MNSSLGVLCLVSTLATASAPGDDAAGLAERVTHHFAEHDAVKIHYVALGEGPLVVMIHGFPDYWYTWRHQMAALATSHRVVALDLRGYNRSDKPKGVDNYDMELLAGDVVAVIRHAGAERAVVVGHDWGGAIAWRLAMTRPEVVERLVILNLPHPRGLLRELATNPEQRAASQYARDFQKPDAHERLTAAGLARWVRDESARARYVEAFERSDFEAMLAYYKRNYPREPYTDPGAAPLPGRVRVPVLMFHGLGDRALLAPALRDTWEWVEQDLTLVTVPGAGHFVQHDAADLVTAMLVAWLGVQESR